MQSQATQPRPTSATRRETGAVVVDRVCNRIPTGNAILTDVVITDIVIIDGVIRGVTKGLRA